MYRSIPDVFCISKQTLPRILDCILRTDLYKELVKNWLALSTLPFSFWLAGLLQTNYIFYIGANRIALTVPNLSLAVEGEHCLKAMVISSDLIGWLVIAEIIAGFYFWLADGAPQDHNQHLACKGCCCICPNKHNNPSYTAIYLIKYNTRHQQGSACTGLPKPIAVSSWKTCF
jgi:hypothetical protein